MNFVKATDPRFETYLKETEYARRNGMHPKAKYYLANLALERLKLYTEAGNEPSEEQISELESRFDLVSTNARGRYELISLRAALIRIWIRPIVWAGVINIDGLTNSEAKNVADAIDIRRAGDETGNLVHETLHMHDDLTNARRKAPSKRSERRWSEIHGFLQETTPIQLGVRHNSAKRFVLPSLAYDDALHETKTQRIDGFLIDNRRKRSQTTILPYQVGWLADHTHVSQLIPVIDPKLLGNIRGSAYWPNDDRDFGTSRRLVTERRTNRLSQEATRTLDSITSTVMNTVTCAATELI